MKVLDSLRSFSLDFERLDIAEYHARPELGSSTLKSLDRDGAELTAARQSTDGESDSRDLLIGSAVHAFIEGDFAERFVCAPDERGYKTGDSDAFETLRAKYANEGRELLTAKEWQTVQACGDALQRKLGSYLVGRQKWIEPSLFWNERDEAGRTVSCKCRPDVLVDCGDGTALYLEIKTIVDNSPRSWRNACYRYGYWIQQAHYAAGIAAKSSASTVRTIFVVVRKTRPITVRLYAFDAITSAGSRIKWRDLVNEYSRRMAHNDWNDEVGLNPTEIDLGFSLPDDLEEME